jgi:hypothetical protein
MKRVEEKLVLKKSIKIFISKLFLCIILFLIGMILVKSNDSYKNKINNLISYNINFTKYRNIYEKYFGNILSIDKIIKEESVFSEKLTYTSSEKYNNGVKLTVTDNYMVPIIDSGVVIYIGDNSYGQSIIISQIDGVEVTYTNVNESNINLYDYVTKGELLGEVSDNNLYLYFKKEGEYLDYKEYI